MTKCKWRFTFACIEKRKISNKKGKIINISSTAGKIGNPRQAVYSASKGGIIAFTKSLAREFARYQININDICPGLTDTPGIDHYARKSDPEYFAKLEQGVPWKRMGQPEEVAAAALFLASDDSSYITGQSLSVDGGVTVV